ncbi:DUF58 domain-containing protein [Tenggerimyces flavus]|uniref:DUF58 domain-containing protein n=1 Tax=Tenggerimyces flavus TaxID=1708749 RepID=A0ABV7YHJ4_9ACTN|nr:DUF58 domain-containing protein [Tenggerimyces flavus]MBM7784302.1 uncharacterized protein (DUF58 family) [Tenggerimyces flavus]
MWHPTRALRRAVVVAALLLGLAVLGGRADFAVLAAPFVLGTAWALLRRPSSPFTVRVARTGERLVEGADVTVEVTVTNEDPAPYDLALAKPAGSEWLGLTDHDRTVGIGVGAEEEATLVLVGKAERWGWHQFGPFEVRAIGIDGLVASDSMLSQSLSLDVFPRTTPFEADDAMPKAAGLVGGHRSRRYGDGGELAGIRRFSSGDRLRRIDWRTSLRTRELHVVHTLSDRDAELVLVVDVLHEAGTSGGIDGSASVLDTTVRAAAGIAEHYLGSGDRLMVIEYGGRGRAMRPGSGRRHYLATLEWLLATTSGERSYGPAEGGFGRFRIPPSALLVVLTPLLDARSVDMLARQVRGGRSIVAVDTLPEDARPAMSGRWSDAAYRLWRMERQNTIGQLLEHGVPTVTWAGAGSLDHVLRDVSRVAATR